MCVRGHTQNLAEPPEQSYLWFPCFFALPDFECVTCILLIKRAMRGKVWWQGTKDCHSYFFKLPGCGILKSNLNMECDECLTEDRRG